MDRHFHEQLQELKGKLVRMSTAVEDSIDKAVRALMQYDERLADEVLRTDDTINRMELELDDDCLRLLALQQPMAADLRFVMSAMKISNDLERMGDHSVNIAEYAKALAGTHSTQPLVPISGMARIAQAMVSDSLAAFMEGNADKARAVCVRDDEVDALNDELFRDTVAHLGTESGAAAPDATTTALTVVLIGKNLERIADLSTNIAEEVIFIVQARTIKHHSEFAGLQDIRHR
jgi:phosphate transport system protein